MSHNCAEFTVAKSCFVRVNWQIPGDFFRKVYIPQTPLFRVFLVSPILNKGGRDCFACPSPEYQDQGYLVWFSPDILYRHESEK